MCKLCRFNKWDGCRAPTLGHTFNCEIWYSLVLVLLTGDLLVDISNVQVSLDICDSQQKLAQFLFIVSAYLQCPKNGLQSYYGEQFRIDLYSD